MITINETSMITRDLHISADTNEIELKSVTKDNIGMISLDALMYDNDIHGYSKYTNILSIIRDPDGEDREMTNLSIPVNLLEDPSDTSPRIRFDVTIDWSSCLLTIRPECGMNIRITLYSNNYTKRIGLRKDVLFPKVHAYIPSGEYLGLCNGVAAMENIIRNSNALDSEVNGSRIKVINGLCTAILQPELNTPEDEILPLQPISDDCYKMMLSAFTCLYTRCAKVDPTSIYHNQSIVQAFTEYVVNNFQKG